MARIEELAAKINEARKIRTDVDQAQDLLIIERIPPNSRKRTQATLGRNRTAYAPSRVY